MAVDSERQNRLLVEHLRRAIDGVFAVYRFGSTARGTATSSSDVDVAILTRTQLLPARRFDVQEALATQLGNDVDLVDLSDASPVMAIQVIADGQLLYDEDSEARGRFEDRIFGAYARLNEERRGILDRIAAEGTVYGR